MAKFTTNTCEHQQRTNFVSNYNKTEIYISVVEFIPFLVHHTTRGRTPLDELPARRRDLYLATHNTHNRQTSMPPAGIETTILASERPQTHALDRAATGIGGLAV
jgi:hypothetical protein